MKLLIVDDHPVVRAGLAALLAGLERGTEVLQAGDCADGLKLAAARPDLDAVLLDLNLPGLSGVPAVQEFGRRHPDLPLVVLSSSEDAEDVRAALAAGALGYVPKSAKPETVLAAIRLVLSGSIYVPLLVLEASAGAPAMTGPAGDDQALTERQADVLRLLGLGLSNKEIGRSLGIAEKTIKAHVGAIFKLLKVTNRVQAVTAAKKSKLL